MRSGRLVVEEVPGPVPGRGQLLVRTVACGICGSDLHALHHGDAMAEMAELTAAANPDNPLPLRFMDPAADVVLGHEFVGEVVDNSQASGSAAVGAVVVSVPATLDRAGLHPIGYSNRYPGGFGALMVLSGPLAITVPNGLDPHLAALTEPMAVGIHAVGRSAMEPGEAAIVLGCGPVGLAVIAALAARGIEPIVASDPSPARRRLAAVMGAHEVVDPGNEAPTDAWRRADPRARGRSLVTFEAVGTPGMIDTAVAASPRRSRIVVVGVCMAPDTFRPMLAVGGELRIDFAFGYEPAEFAQSLRSIAEGAVDVAPLVTGRVAPDAVAGAFADLADPEAHAKILVVH